MTLEPLEKLDVRGLTVELDCDGVREQRDILERHLATGEPLSYDEAHTIYDYGVVSCWWEFENVGGGLYKYVGEREGAD